MAGIDSILNASYNHYKNNMVGPNGQSYGIKDAQDIDSDGDTQELIILSEAASYVLLRAALMNDEELFDKVWTWTSNNLQRKNINRVYNPKSKSWEVFPASKKDNLFAWRYFQKVGNEAGGVLSTYDFDPAPDADQDIAAALLLAHKKWGSSGNINYQQEALAILEDIWNKETRMIAGKRVLLGGPTQHLCQDPFTGRQTYGINPSYFRPNYYASLFAEADLRHDWRSMTAPAQELIVKVADATLHNEQRAAVQGRVNLSPDWFAIDEDFNIHNHGWRTGDHVGRPDYYFDGDANRILFWMATRSQLVPSETTAQKYLTDHTNTSNDYGPYAFLKQQLNLHGTIYSGYNIDGSVHWEYDDLQALANYMYYFLAGGDRSSSQKLFEKIMGTYNPEGFWKTEGTSSKDFYYAQNWIWFNLFVMTYGPGSFLGEAAPSTQNQFPFSVNPPATAPSTSAALPATRIYDGKYEFNGGRVEKTGETFCFKASQAKDPGFGISLRPTSLEGRNTLEFEIRGEITQHGKYARLVAQVFLDTDREGAPSITSERLEVTPDYRTQSIDLKGKAGKIKKIQFMLITDNSTCCIAIKDIRFK